LVTLALVAFGLVMVYSATSASAALHNGDPAYFLKRQAGYALLGLVLLVAASRADYRLLRGLAPVLIVSSLALLLGVLVAGQAVIGLGSGGIFGRGLGQSVAKLNFLPAAHTDMIFAIIGEELGLVGATALVAAYGAFAYAGLRIALTCRDPFGKRLAAGLTV